MDLLAVSCWQASYDMAEKESAVLLTVQDGVAGIILNRPEKRNALNDTLVAGLKVALRAAEATSEKTEIVEMKT